MMLSFISHSFVRIRSFDCKNKDLSTTLFEPRFHCFIVDLLSILLFTRFTFLPVILLQSAILFKMAGLTDLAKKYGHPVGAGQSIISFTGKSGLTPLIEVPDYAISNVQLDYKNTYHLYQRHRIAGGFGTHELMDLDAFAPLFDWQEENLPDGGVDISYLNIAIHPLLQRQNWTQRLWDHMPKYPLKGGRVGYYEV